MAFSGPINFKVTPVLYSIKYYKKQKKGGKWNFKYIHDFGLVWFVNIKLSLNLTNQNKIERKIHIIKLQKNVTKSK